MKDCLIFLFEGYCLAVLAVHCAARLVDAKGDLVELCFPRKISTKPFFG